MASASTSPGSLAAIIVAAVPIVLGGVTTYFKIFLVPKQDFRYRIRLKRTELLENLAMKLVTLLQHVRSLCLTGPQDAPLRGDGREQPDLVDEYSRENLRVFTVYHRLGTLEKVVSYSYLWLFITIAAGIAGVFCAGFVPVSRPWIPGASIGIVAAQVLIVLVVQLSAWKLDKYEDIA